MSLALPGQASLVSLRVLPDDVMLAVVGFLGHAARRAFACTDQYARRLLAPQRQFDSLVARARWLPPIQAIGLLRLPHERREYEGPVLEVFSERIGWVRRPERWELAVGMIGRLGALAEGARGRVLCRIATAVGAVRPRPLEFDRTLLSMVDALGPNEREKVLALCLHGLFPDIGRELDLGQWIGVARGLSPHVGQIVLAHAIDRVSSDQRPNLERLSIILDFAMAGTGDIPSPAQLRLAEKVLVLATCRGSDIAHDFRAAAWDALFDMVVAHARPEAAARSAVYMLWHVVARGDAMTAEFGTPRLARIEQLCAAKPSLAPGRIDGRICDASNADEDYAKAGQRLQQARNLNGAAQSARYANKPWKFVPPRRDEHAAAWLALFEAGLRQIDALEPPSLRTAPLQAWARALPRSADPQAWAMIAGRTATLPDAERLDVLLASINNGAWVPDLAGFIDHTATLSPARRAIALKQLASHITKGEEEHDQQARLQLVMAAVRELPPEARMTVIPSLVRCTGWLWSGAMEVIRPDIDATLPLLTLSQHAGMVAELIGRQLTDEARIWVLEQLAVLETRQRECAVDSFPAVPYRAEVLRRLLFGMTKLGNAMETSPMWPMQSLWPKVRDALERVEAEYRQGPLDVLRDILPELQGPLQDEVRAVLGKLSEPARSPDNAAVAGRKRLGSEMSLE